MDPGADANIITETFVERHGLATRTKEPPYHIVNADGSVMAKILRETVPLEIVVGTHREELQFDIARVANHNIMLGIPWFIRHNPDVDWRRRVLTLRCNCGNYSRRPTLRQSSGVDETAQVNEMSCESTKVLTYEQPPRTDAGLGVQTRSQSREKRSSALEIPEPYKRFALLFQEAEGKEELPPNTPWDCEIELVPGARLPFDPLYKRTKDELQFEKEWTAKMLRLGRIRPSKSRIACSSFAVPKPGTTKLRMVIDYRKLNAVTIKNRYPIPNIDEAMDRIIGANWFTKIDLRDAFYTIRMKPGHEWKTAFRLTTGLYEFTVMPMGFTNSPAVQQNMINDVLRDLLNDTVVAYIDDILIFTKGPLNQHIKDVQAVFERLSKTSFRTAPEKCEFHVKETKFLGFIIGHEGIKIDPIKIEAILNWPTPENVTDVQSFLGHTNYNRKFIEKYSHKAIPLTKLTKKEVKFKWDTDQERAFKILKQAITTAPVLRTYDPEKPLRMETDASDEAIGACLLQEHNGNWHPIAYYSRKMIPAETNYPIYDKELLAIVAALDHWRVYAESAPELTIFTDHKNLLYFTTTKVLTKRHLRWSERLGQYKFKILYVKGRENGRADTLSRRSDYMKNKTTVEDRILKKNEDGSLSAAYEGQYNTATKEDVNDIIKRYHDGPLQGHPGISKTMKLIQRDHRIPRLRDEVEKYIRRCETCQKNKASRHAPYGYIQYQQPSQKPWDDVTMDFIVKLPKSKDPMDQTTYDSILVMVDRLTKYAHFIPCRETDKTNVIATRVLDRLVRYHGIPKTITTDRDPKFRSHFWRTLTATMGITHKLSTAYHPQTDGQTERTNQTLEVYLRHYVNYEQDNWVSLLPLAQLALNNHESETTKVSPYYANFGRHPNLFQEEKPHPNAQQAITRTENMKKLHEYLREKIQDMQKRLEPRINKKRKSGPLLREGDKVYLLTKNLKTRRKTKKLDNVKVGPFLVEQKIGPVNYRLRLPEDAKIHPVFHVSLLEPADPETPLQTTFHFALEEEDQYEVERILDKRDNTYLVKWKGYEEEENTWEPVQHLRNCYQKIKDYHKGNNLPRELSSRKEFNRWIDRHIN